MHIILLWYVDMLLRINLTFSLHIPVTICVFTTSRVSDKYDTWMFLEYSFYSSLNFLEIGVRYYMFKFKCVFIQVLQWNTESSRLLDRFTEVCPSLEMWIISLWRTEALQAKIAFRYFFIKFNKPSGYSCTVFFPGMERKFWL